MYIINSGTSTDFDFEEILLNDKPKKWYQKIKLPIFFKDFLNLFIPYSILFFTLIAILI